jgi:hypothetical protein
LWAGRDTIAARFVDALYGDLVPQGLHADDAARSVHRALFALRERYRVPAAWAPFAHLGPYDPSALHVTPSFPGM